MSDSRANDRNTVPRCRPEIFVPASEAVPVVDFRTDSTFTISVVGRHVLELCDGTRAVEDMVADVVATFEGTECDEVRRDIDEFLQASTDKDLIEWVSRPESLLDTA